MSSRSSGDNEKRRSLKTQMLQELDGFVQDKDRPVFIVAATNCPWDIDAAMMSRLPAACPTNKNGQLCFATNFDARTIRWMLMWLPGRRTAILQRNCHCCVVMRVDLKSEKQFKAYLMASSPACQALTSLSAPRTFFRPDTTSERPAAKNFWNNLQNFPEVDLVVGREKRQREYPTTLP